MITNTKGILYMNELQLQQNETVLLKEQGILCKGISKSYSDDLYLTNLHLILVRKGAWGKFKGLEKYPLNQIKRINGQIQARCIDDDLHIFFLNSQVVFDFGGSGKRAVNTFIEGINSAINGTPINNAKASTAIPGSEILANTLKDTFGTFKNAFGIKSKVESITVKCIGCHAPLAGTKGEKVRCAYCDTEQTL